MKAYIGSKIILAEREDRDKGENGSGGLGYKVIYPDGYESWSPKEVFETAYREIIEGEVDLVVDTLVDEAEMFTELLDDIGQDASILENSEVAETENEQTDG